MCSGDLGLRILALCSSDLGLRILALVSSVRKPLDLPVKYSDSFCLCSSDLGLPFF